MLKRCAIIWPSMGATQMLLALASAFVAQVGEPTSLIRSGYITLAQVECTYDRLEPAPWDDDNPWHLRTVVHSPGELECIKRYRAVCGVDGEWIFLREDDPICVAMCERY